jgi:hypothetical protein
MWGIRVIVPASLRSSVLSQLHETHPGVVRMKSLARQHVWWPGIDSDIEQLSKSCTSCAVNRDNPAVAPLHPWSFPEKPWQRIHMDLAGPFLGSMWLIIVDAFTKWPEVFRLGKDSTSANVISFVRETFSRFGLPETIVSDNGPQFVSSEFESFCVKNGVRHTTSSAYHPRSNGEAERFVRTFKSAMSASEMKGRDNLSLCQFLLTYRNTPHATTGASPSELMQKRKLRTGLDLIRPDVNSKVRSSQELQEEQFNGKSQVRAFHEGQSVWVKTFSKDTPKWSLGVIVRAVGPVSYEVRVGERVIKRHVDHILSGELSHFNCLSDRVVVDIPQQPDAVPSPSKPPALERTPIKSPQNQSPKQNPVASPVRVQEPTAAEVSASDADSSLNVSRYGRRREAPKRLTYDNFK